MTKNHSKYDNQNGDQLMVFVQDGCLHCNHAEEFLKANAEKYKDVNIVFYNLKDGKAQTLCYKNILRLNIPQKNLGTPIFIKGDEYIIGFGEKEKSNLERLLSEKKIKDGNSGQK